MIPRLVVAFVATVAWVSAMWVQQLPECNGKVPDTALKCAADGVLCSSYSAADCEQQQMRNFIRNRATLCISSVDPHSHCKIETVICHQWNKCVKYNNGFGWYCSMGNAIVDEDGEIVGVYGNYAIISSCILIEPT